MPVTAAHVDQPPDLPDFPGDLANPTEDPEPPTPPVDNPSPSGDSMFAAWGCGALDRQRP